MTNQVSTNGTTNLNDFKVEKRTVKLSDIIQNPKFNSRHILGDIDGFIETIKKNKILTNPVCRIKDGKIHLVAGFRRCAAWGKMHGHDALIDIDIKEFSSDADAELFNLAENTGREDLRKYDLCERIFNLCETQGLKQTRVAATINKTQGYISQCLAIWKDLSPDSKKWWSKIEKPEDEPTLTELKIISKGSPSEQKEAIEKLTSGTDNWSEGIQGDDKEKSDKPVKRTQKEIKEMLQKFSSKLEDATEDDIDVIKDRIAVLKWVLGERKTLQ